MTIDEMIAILQAYKEGKKIQCKQVPSGNWCTVVPNWNFRDCDYRIKPEPHYRPFKDAEEVMEAIKEHGNWLDNSVGYKVNITEFNNSMIWIGAAKGGITFDDAFNNHNFEKDGTPFGKLED